MRIERGDIWWVNLDPTVGREIKKKRPCVVLSANEINSIRATPIVVPLSSPPEIAPPVVLAVPGAGRQSVAVIDQLRSVDKKRFVNQAGAISPADLQAIESAVNQILALP
jgi:mRNA interferase MazF